MFKKYARKSKLSELRPYTDGEVLDGRVTISDEDREAGSPKVGDMIAHDPKNHDDEWLIGAAYFEANFDPDPVD